MPAIASRSISRTLRTITLLGALIVAARSATAQSSRAFSVFLDCSTFNCDEAFFRTDIDFVDHVRERTAADVHVLMTEQRTGGGGTVYVLAFYGQHMFAGVNDTLSVTMPQGATDDEQRQALSRTVKLGLARYIGRTAAATRATLVLTAGDSTTAGPAKRDPWNSWVFRLGANVNASREHDSKSDFVFGSFNVSRLTERWKTNLRVYENYNGQAFIVSGADPVSGTPIRERVASVRRDFGGTAQQVRSFGPHWSAGFNANAGSSTFLNQHLVASIAPAVEYDLFPYSEFARRALVFQYSVGVRHFLYNDTTVYFKTSETRPFEAINVALGQTQKWGTLRAEINGYHFLDDVGKSRLTFFTEADVRLFKGLSLNLFGNYSVLHDQLYLAKEKVTRDGVLLQQSQRATKYRAFLFAGINYTFGSVRNNIVNPRFSSARGEF